MREALADKPPDQLGLRQALFRAHAAQTGLEFRIKSDHKRHDSFLANTCMNTSIAQGEIPSAWTHSLAQGWGGSLAHIPIVAEARRIPVLVLQHLPRPDIEARGLLHHTLYPVPDIA